MRQKSIQLDENYRLNNGVVEGFFYNSDRVKYDRRDEGGNDERCPLCKELTVSIPDRCECDAWNWRPTKYEIGAEVILISHEYVGPDRERRTGPTFSIVFDAPNGIVGNIDHNITRYHGWRGSVDDISMDAHGLRRITGIREMKNGRVSITVGRDLVPDED